MKLRLELLGRLLIIATGDQADELENYDDDDELDGGQQRVVAGAPSADLMQAPEPGWDPRADPYGDRRRPPRRMGFVP